ncbi:zinc ribbon domain-containing protein [Methanocella sp. CWC-04]|uniref:Zinc ribbon domain-containing protein n=1 Tax=Methanooceanicella nereidis TaxID=2052831 RepID=A0AAP2RFZ6_9EURY|nr:zinc ribbon domain-containing protein [Methanocella sp. CWC-04]MCD1296076.1 zinc ribbon domain-containing protein [Methanocella sp. CWC-04]
MAEIKCTKCGAPIAFDSGDKFAKCKYCDTQIFIDKSGAGFFYIMPYFIDQANAQGIFKRWTAGSLMARDLEATARIISFKQQYFPVYLFKRDVDGKEKVQVEPARSTTLPGLHSLKVPAGDIKIFDQNYDAGGIELLKPDIDMAAYLPQLPGTAKEQALVFFPLWTIQYEYKGRKYDAVIDGSSGEVFSTDYPTRKAAPYFIIAAIAFIAFLIEGLIGVLLWPVGFACGGALALVTIPVVFIAAYTIVRRF